MAGLRSSHDSSEHICVLRLLPMPSHRCRESRHILACHFEEYKCSHGLQAGFANLGSSPDFQAIRAMRIRLRFTLSQSESISSGHGTLTGLERECGTIFYQQQPQFPALRYGRTAAATSRSWA